MFKDFRYINAGENEIYRWGKKAQQRVIDCMTPNEKGFYGICADGGNYWTIGTSTGKYGEFVKFEDKFLSVNSVGVVWARVGTEKEKVFLAMCKSMLDKMKNMG